MRFIVMGVNPFAVNPIPRQYILSFHLPGAQPVSCRSGVTIAAYQDDDGEGNTDGRSRA